MSSSELCLKVLINEKRGGLKVEMGLQIDIEALSVSSKNYFYNAKMTLFPQKE
jgi:hypothetical protein